MDQIFNQAGDAPTTPRSFTYCPECATRMPSTPGVACPNCGFIQHHNPLPGVSVIIRRADGDVLVGERRAEPGSWCLPCGFIEGNENFLMAAHREVREETGLTIRIRSVVNVVSNVISPTLESLVVVLLAEPVAGTPRADDDLIALEWIGPDRIPPMAFDADRYIITALFEDGLTELPVDPRLREWDG